MLNQQIEAGRSGGNMKKTAVLILALLLVLGIVAGCADNKSEDKTTVGFDAEFPPYGYMDDNGEYTGFDLDLAQEVCARRGWELVKQPINWDSKDSELDSGAIDCIWNGFTINGREDDYTWSSPYVNNSQVFVVAASAGIQDQAGLAGKLVAVQKESSALAALESEDNTDLLASFEDLLQFGDYNTAFMNRVPWMPSRWTSVWPMCRLLPAKPASL